MTENYKILAEFIKDMSSETPDIETYLFVKDHISKYHLTININSKALKNQMIEVCTTLKYEDKEASEKLSSNSNSITTESSFSATDLAFCALGSIAVFPQNYSRNVISMGKLEDFPEEYQNIINHCRKTLAGKFITETYNSKRL